MSEPISMDKTYKTKDGRKVRIYAVDGYEGGEVHGAVYNKGDGWAALTWDMYGYHVAELVCLVEVKTAKYYKDMETLLQEFNYQFLDEGNTLQLTVSPSQTLFLSREMFPKFGCKIQSGDSVLDSALITEKEE